MFVKRRKAEKLDTKNTKEGTKSTKGK